MDLGISGKRALVLAASRGLGLGIAKALAAEGAHVLICGRTEDKLKANVDAIKAAGGKADYVVADLADAHFVDQMLQAVHNTLGGIDILVNNTGGPTPGTAEEIQEFCSATYGVSFPMTEKIEVNGEGRHPLYAELTGTPDEKGEAGDVTWNFEKFLVAADGTVVSRFSPGVEPQDPRLVTAVEEIVG